MIKVCKSHGNYHIRMIRDALFPEHFPNDTVEERFHSYLFMRRSRITTLMHLSTII